MFILVCMCVYEEKDTQENTFIFFICYFICNFLRKLFRALTVPKPYLLENLLGKKKKFD